MGTIVTYVVASAVFALMDYDTDADELAIAATVAGIVISTPRMSAIERAQRRRRFDRRCRRNAAR